MSTQGTDGENVTIPDIPISEYDDPPTIKASPFWERDRSINHGFSEWVLNPAEVSLVTAHQITSKRFSDIQREVGAWAWKNFGKKAQGDNPLLGMIEELGELSRAILKKDQGIRGTPEEHDRDAIDAIGDITVYLMNHLNASEVDISDLVSTGYLSRIDLAYDRSYTGSIETVRRNLCFSILGSINHFLTDTRNAAGTLLVYLEILSRSYGFDLLNILEKTWAIVGKRNWVIDPEVGGSHSHK